MSTPLDRAAQALEDYVSDGTESDEASAHAAHEALSAALDVDEMARVLDEHRRLSPAYMETSLCGCGARFKTAWRHYRHQAEALRAHLLGEAS